MARRYVTEKDLKEWINNYRSRIPNKPQQNTYKVIEAANETVNCIISVAEIRDLIAHIDEQNKSLKEADKIGGLKIYLIRQALYTSTLFIEGGVPQIGLAIVPANHYGPTGETDPGTQKEKYGSQNYFEGPTDNRKIMCVFLPNERSEHTGLCPVNCGGSL